MTTQIQGVIQNPDLIKDHLRMMALGINAAISYNNRQYREWPITTVIGDITLGDTNTVVLADATTAAIVATLPVVADVAERIYTVKKTDGSTNAVTLMAESTGVTIDGSTSKVIVSQFVSHTVIADGSNWHII